MAEACQHPQIKARNMIVEVSHPQQGQQQQIGCPIKFSGYQTQYHQTGSTMGADGQHILQDLGLNEQQINNLIAQGAVKL